ncbi:Ig-like domain-containing protein [Candidatus Moduliflexota bacterium]
MLKTTVQLVLVSASMWLPASLSAGEGQNSGEPLKVVIVTLEQDQRVHGQIIVEAQVNRPEELKAVEFYFREPGAEDRYSWFDYVPPYFWGGDGKAIDTTLFEDGPASAVAFGIPSADGAPVVEHRVKLFIDNGKPKVRILSPKDGASVWGQVSVRMEAGDHKGLQTEASINSVSLYLDGGLVREMKGPEFQTELDTCLLVPGLHSLRAVAEDSEGLTGSHRIFVSTEGDAPK